MGGTEDARLGGAKGVDLLVPDLGWSRTEASVTGKEGRGNHQVVRHGMSLVAAQTAGMMGPCISSRPALQRYDWGSLDRPSRPPGDRTRRRVHTRRPGGGRTRWASRPSTSAERWYPSTRSIASDPIGDAWPEVAAAYDDQLPLPPQDPRDRQTPIDPGSPERRGRAGGLLQGGAGGDTRGTRQHRVYRDDHHKPEMIVALTPMVLLRLPARRAR